MNRMKLVVANVLNIAFENAPDAVVVFLQKHIPDLLSENDQPADVTVRFVEQLETGADMYIGPIAAKRGNEFLYIDKYHNRAIVPIGDFPHNHPIEILAERTIIPALFYEIILRMVIRYRLLLHDITFIHASGIAVDGEGIVFPAWGGTGKTNMVIQFLRDGASYLGDDLVLGDSNGMLYAFPESISMFDYNFKTFPEYKKMLGTKKQALFLLKQTMEWMNGVATKTLSQESLFRATIARMATLSKSFTTVSMSCSKLSPSCKVAPSIPLTKAVLLTKADILKPEVIEESPDALAVRMAACLDFEHLFHMHYVDAFSFAFPDRSSGELRHIHEKEQEILAKTFSRASVYHLRIPREMDSKQLYHFTRDVLGV